MARCFVAQPFDAGEFDKRYAQVYEPAIKAASLEPYRVDRDPSASVVIDTIIAQIKTSVAFFVDITTDNPNVWFELGVAIANGQDACIVCSEKRERFPFDVQHRNIIRYKTEAPHDFEDLRDKISARLRAIVDRQSSLEVVEKHLIRSPIGVSELETSAMAVIASVAKFEGQLAEISAVYTEMERSGYRAVATTVAIRRLTKAQLIASYSEEDYNGYRQQYVKINERGWQWIEANLAHLIHRRIDDDIPF